MYQIFSQAQPSLDITALAYAKAGIATNDAVIACFKAKYIYNVERPIRYIRDVLGLADWNAVIINPPHPEFPSAHAINGSAIMGLLTSVFGKNLHFTDHTFDFLGLAPRSYTSLNSFAHEAAISRFYAGIHYRWSVEKGEIWGKKIAQNIFAKVKFKK